MVNDATRQALSVIAELHSLFESWGIDHWLMGGWAVDFYAGRVTRDHDDVDFAVWLNDVPRLKTLLERAGWRHSPKEDEDGGTGFSREILRLEFTYLVRDKDGSAFTPLRDKHVPWSKDALGEDVLQLGLSKCRTVSLQSLKNSKSSPRQDSHDAAKDQADLKVLLQVALERKLPSTRSSTN